MKLEELATTSRLVSETSARLDKIERLAASIERMNEDEVVVGVSCLVGELRQGKIGIGASMLHAAQLGQPAAFPTLSLQDLDRTFEDIARVRGKGSANERLHLLAALFLKATANERVFITRLVTGELRQGALEGVVLEAVARASKVSSGIVRRALMLSGQLGTVAALALSGGEPALSAIVIIPGKPVLPALAQPAEDVTTALSQIERGALEYKMDGARVQIHKAGSSVAVFTRRLKDVTDRVPEIVEAVQRLPAKEMILDGEVLAFREDGNPHAFQNTMRRFGRKLGGTDLRRRLPLRPYFFDCLYLDGQTLVDAPGVGRHAALVEAVRPDWLMPRIVTEQLREAEDFFRDALSAGHEGIMVKATDAPYKAGERGRSWLKVKRFHTLDLVILAAEWGHGRREGWLSNLHLGARDPATQSFVMLGKTFKGLTDAMLRQQTARLQNIAIASNRHTVFVRPEIVVEIAFSDIQASPQYPAGLALRFARVRRYRPDKRPQDVDSVETVRALYQAHER